MPYIIPKRRQVLDAYADSIIQLLKDTNFDGSYLGDLNYLLTRILLGTFRKINGKIRYWQVTAIMGTLSAMQVEIYRRVMSPFENAKLRENADVLEFAQYDQDLMPEEEKDDSQGS